MKMPLLSKVIAAMIAIAGLTVCPPSYADDWDDPGDDPGDDPRGLARRGGDPATPG